MDNAVASKRPQLRPLRRAAAVLFWTALLVLGTFGLVFSFANYPALEAGILVLIVGVTAYAERKRRAAVKERSTRRRQERLNR
jgi:hypothetical protein